MVCNVVRELRARCTTICFCDLQIAKNCTSQFASRKSKCTTVSVTLLAIPKGIAKCEAHEY